MVQVRPATTDDLTGITAVVARGATRDAILADVQRFLAAGCDPGLMDGSDLMPFTVCECVRLWA